MAFPDQSSWSPASEARTVSLEARAGNSIEETFGAPGEIPRSAPVERIGLQEKACRGEMVWIEHVRPCADRVGDYVAARVADEAPDRLRHYVHVRDVRQVRVLGRGEADRDVAPGSRHARDRKRSWVDVGVSPHKVVAEGDVGRSHQGAVAELDIGPHAEGDRLARGTPPVAGGQEVVGRGRRFGRVELEQGLVDERCDAELRVD